MLNGCQVVSRGSAGTGELAAPPLTELAAKRPRGTPAVRRSLARNQSEDTGSGPAVELGDRHDRSFPARSCPSEVDAGAARARNLYVLREDGPELERQRPMDPHSRPLIFRPRVNEAYAGRSGADRRPARVSRARAPSAGGSPRGCICAQEGFDCAECMPLDPIPGPATGASR